MTPDESLRSLTLIQGKHIMGNVVLNWALANKDALDKVELTHSLVVAIEKEMQK